MIFLEIFTNPDGSIAWLNIAVIILAGIIGYLIGGSPGKKQINRLKDSMREKENQLRKAENDFKSYKTGHEASFKQHERSVADMNMRVKSLEGDIKALADEKNRLFHKIEEKEDAIKASNRQVSTLEEKIKLLILEEEKHLAEKEKLISEITGKWKTTGEELGRARSWEEKVHAAEEDARKARQALADHQRRSIDFDLRLKSASEYAAKVQPLENELKTMQQKFEDYKQEITSKNNISTEIEEKLRSSKATIDILNKELTELKNAVASKENINQELRDKLETATQSSGKIIALESEIKTLKETNAVLQQELAERSALLKQFRKDAEQVQSSGIVTTMITADAALLTEDEPGQGEES
jgi:chromosome segregation ATPase